MVTKVKQLFQPAGLNASAFGKKVENLGFSDPFNQDVDERQLRIANFIFDEMKTLGFEVNIVEGYDCSTLVKPGSDPVADDIYGFLQPRADREGEEEDIAYYARQFYELMVKLIFIPICLDWKGITFPLSGNKRMRGHLTGLTADPSRESRAHYVSLKPPEGMPEHIILRLASKISRISNDGSVPQVRPMKRKDYVNSIRSDYEICVKDPTHWARDLSTHKVGETKLRKFGQAILKEMHYYPHATEESNIINKAFGLNGRSWGVAEKKDIKEIETLYNQIYPKQKWSAEVKGGTYCQKVSASRVERNPMVPLIERSWQNRKQFSPVRDEANLYVELEQKMDSIQTVEDTKENIVKLYTAYNTNQNYEGCGMPLVTRILFPNHLVNGDKPSGYLWNKQADCFDEV